MSESEKITLTQEEMDCIIYDAREGDLESLKEIFAEYPADLLLTIKDDITLSTPYHMAAANGHLEVIKYLLSIIPKEDAIKLANQKNESLNTPLHWAAFNGHLPIVQLLCEEYNADVYAKNETGHDSIFEAENNNKEEVENWLLNKYAVEDGFKVEDQGENTKITYTPGKESKEADDRAKEAAAAAASSSDDINKQTADLSIH
ncbi:hypothetical protein HYPBUDRAFT_151211 [Hyphopichia burtonii NRRL Y-1933]|uniref:Uncharacterized protein n=1 Tax=Hyphopichia burtonii NRRL Y-1933 TaxID=984485 RepID=A0A1E4RQ98_9ASCO|nr:hypothetical protein HYPBUDRAFT_151211 [Hyphopichia burtonii NRRL Y-1933]ODV69449.1 hypothetical protein HYPBUDRAFT_151211 [Hyphopichia burtonii NRRL Y-1933]